MHMQIAVRVGIKIELVRHCTMRSFEIGERGAPSGTVLTEGVYLYSLKE